MMNAIDYHHTNSSDCQPLTNDELDSMAPRHHLRIGHSGILEYGQRTTEPKIEEASSQLQTWFPELTDSGGGRTIS